jgi:DNA polymerase-3 subunit epsilon
VSAIAKITYELCGNELIALLKESDEIHRLFPIYNRVQKFDRGSYILTEYVNQKGVRQLAFGKEHKALKPLLHFRGFDAAREYMNELVENYELCPRFSGLQSTTGVCFNFGLSKCRGVCAGIEDVDAYNERVRAALSGILEGQETRVIVDEGRAYNERSVILIENGVYKGYGFTERQGEITPEIALEIVEPARQTNDILKILRMWFRGEEYQEVEI